MALTFADTHNMIAYLTKSNASEGFEQMLNFLNASVINYALTVNPTIYVSCIKQFWSSVSIKKTNDVVRLQALIDRKKVLITEDTVRQALHLDDAESIDCLPNEEIFAELARMGYEKPSIKLTFYKAFFSAQWKFLIHTILQCMSSKRTTWNEFSSSMASAVICLATGKKFNFSKYIFDSLVRNVDSSSKFYMVGKGFFRVDKPLFEGISVPQQAADDVVDVVVDDVVADVVVDVDAKPTSPSPTPITTTTPPPPSQEDASKQVGIIVELDADEDVTLEEVDAAKDAEVKKNADVQGRLEDVTRKRKGVVIRDPEETDTPSTIVHSEPKSKNKGKGILAEEPKPLKKQAQIEQDEAYAR
nr:hypothetical protein [Tanacetum cinerariifolium]